MLADSLRNTFAVDNCNLFDRPENNQRALHILSSYSARKRRRRQGCGPWLWQALSRELTSRLFYDHLQLTTFALTSGHQQPATAPEFVTPNSMSSSRWSTTLFELLEQLVLAGGESLVFTRLFQLVAGRIYKQVDLVQTETSQTWRQQAREYRQEE